MTQEFGEHQDFFRRHFTPSAFKQDPDEVLKYLLSVMEKERLEEEDLLAGILDLFDVDRCPAQYLKYLAYSIGLKLYAEDPEQAHREQIKQAIRWYKEKGTPLSFRILFRSLGYDALVWEIWTDDIECRRNYEILPYPDYYCSDIPSGWTPHSRIDLDIFWYPGYGIQFSDFASFKQFILTRVEEVRPIHVLLRVINIIAIIFDSYPSELIHEEDTDFLIGDLREHFISAYYWKCGIWHFWEPQFDIERDGGNIYTWFRPAADFLTTPPGTPATGDRYIVEAPATGAWTGHEAEIAEWNGTSWDFTVPSVNDAIWALHGAAPDPDTEDPGGYRAYFWTGTVWQEEWTLFDRRFVPGPYFRDCQGEKYYHDKLECYVRWTPPADDFSWCFYHDASAVGLPPHPINGGIQLRDGMYKRNCGEAGDDLEIIPTSGPISTPDVFDPPDSEVTGSLRKALEDDYFPPDYWDDPSLHWDDGTLWDKGRALDEVQFIVHDHVGMTSYPAPVIFSN